MNREDPKSKVLHKLSDGFDLKSQEMYKILFEEDLSPHISADHSELPPSQHDEKIVVINESTKKNRAKYENKTESDFKKKSVDELRQLAKENNIKGARSFSKNKLIDILQQFEPSNSI